MREPGPTPPDADERPRPEDDKPRGIAEFEESLTLAAAAPGRRRLRRLEELLLLRAAGSTHDRRRG